MAELVHGNPSTYNNHKCRCAACTAAWASYIRERGYVRRYQQRKREEKQNEAGKIPQVIQSDRAGTGESGLRPDSFRIRGTE